MRYISIGHKVMVHIPDEDKVAHRPVCQFHGQEFKIADRKVVGHSNNVYYTLVGVESKYGIPYAFVREWLILI